MEMDNTGSFKAICTICYEDLKPFVEDLQAVSICGHVFHELCLQQWFECSRARKQTCPVCKQNCSGNKACRLYFQSIGDANDSNLSQQLNDHSDDPEALHREVQKLEGKVSSLTSIVERQGKDLQGLNHELCQCKEQLKRETALKDEASMQKATIQHLLNTKFQELDKSNMECLRLQERNISLAKELAALKLVTDLDLEEDEILKLASLGNDSNSKETIDILRKSLVIRNKSYKDLMAKCNLLGRGEARYSRKLEKAKEKISKLKIRVQELETAVETKENEVLRAIKISKKSGVKEAIQNGDTDNCVPSSTTNKLCVEDSPRQLPKDVSNFQTHMLRKSSNFCEIEEPLPRKNAGGKENDKSDNLVTSKHLETITLIDEDIPELPLAEQAHPTSKLCQINRIAIISQEAKKSSVGNKEAMMQNVPSSPVRTLDSRSRTSGNFNECNAPADDDVMILDVNPQAETILNIRKENSSQLPFSRPGDICFSGGLLGPDGTSRYLGKWCKRGQNNALKAMQGSSISSGNLITVGPDGRGGRIKVLRSSIQSSLNDKENSAKRCRSGCRTSISQSQGCLQIEHFFQKRNP